MPLPQSVPVVDLALDLKNFRTVAQPDELQAVHAMITIRPERFWALMKSLLDDGYLPTESILVLKDASPATTLTVKEGNRRVAALKLIHGLYPAGSVTLPANITNLIASCSPSWLAANSAVPCTVYDHGDAAIVDRIVTLTHGKDQQAGRDTWTPVARARHNRDAEGRTEPALNLLESYLRHATNRSPAQAERWAGDYPLSVLDEALKRIAPRLGVASAPALAKSYPSTPHKALLDKILLNIGQEDIGFATLRGDLTELEARYGLPPAPSAPGTGNGGAGNTSGGSGLPGGPGASGGTNTTGTNTAGGGGGSGTATGGTASGGVAGGSTTTGTKKTAAVGTSDPKSVKRALRKFVPKGVNREKVVDLRNEALKLNLQDNPLAFCFLLRSMFEISAKAYCQDHAAAGGPTPTKRDGSDKKLVDLLRDITNHLTQSGANKAMQKLLHGPMTELAKPEGILSVTSLNQLVHNPKSVFKNLPEGEWWG
jgi:hypothetical protein